MLDTTNLTNFCKGITNTIRAETGTTAKIQHAKIDEEIKKISVPYSILRHNIEGQLSVGDCSYFFAYSDITDSELLWFANTFTDMIAKPYYDGFKYKNCSYVFAGCKNLTVIPKGAIYGRCLQGTNQFTKCDNLKAIYVPLYMFDFLTTPAKPISDLRNILPLIQIGPSSYGYNTTLEELRIEKGSIGASLDFHYWRKLSKDSVRSILAGTSQNASTKTLTLPNTDYGKLEESEYAETIAKGWTIAFA